MLKYIKYGASKQKKKQKKNTEQDTDVQTF